MKKLSKHAMQTRNKQLVQLVKDSWGRLFLAILCMLIMAGATSAIPFLIKPAVDDIFIKKDQTMLILIPLAVILVYSILGVAMYFQEYLMNYVGQNIIMRLRNALYNKISDLPVSFFHQETTGVLMSRITNDVNIVKAMVSTAITGSLRDIFTVIGLISVVFYRDWKMAFIALIVLPFAFFPVVKLGKKVRKVSTGTQESVGDLNSFLHETFSGNIIVKAFGMELFEKLRFEKKSRLLFKLEMKAVKAKTLVSPIMECLGGFGVALVIWYGGSQVIAGTSTPGTFFSFMGAVLMLYGPVKKLSKLNSVVQAGLAGADRIFDIITRETDIVESENAAMIKTEPHNVIFQDVTFKYGDKEVLKDINLHVRKGEIVALVGMSGGGKTSLVNLIPRFYDVSKGSIFIDDLDVRNISIASLREQIAIVTQSPILFNDTIRNNIAYGNMNATDEQIISAANGAYALDFIQSLPKKFEASVGELGGRLSGGEKQRICIARALFKNAPILILDEATSSLDAESEMLVQKALENLMKGRTTFVIAHRLSTISYADRIVVIVDGQIKEEGTHRELLDRQGEYYKLYNIQFKHIM
jgi:subfamily B ATP-binding cassette protein MsbA